jgi:Cu+-exporting ATPase
VANGDARVGDRTNCPVSGEEFVVTASSPTVEHEGKTYYMCCPGCSARFRANPQQYITAMAQRASGTAATAPAAH